LWEFNDAINSRKSWLSVITTFARTSDDFEEDLQALCGRQTAIVCPRGAIRVLVVPEYLRDPFHTSSVAEAFGARLY
jgi:hypothetical protein